MEGTYLKESKLISNISAMGQWAGWEFATERGRERERESKAIYALDQDTNLTL